MQQQEDECDSQVLAGGQQRPQVQEQEIQTMMFIQKYNFISQVKAVYNEVCTVSLS